MEYIIGFILGWVIAIWYLNLVVKDFLSKMDIKVDTVTVRKVPQYNVEKHGSILYMFDDDDNFITQGQTIEELINNLDNHKKVTVAIITHSDSVLYVDQGRVQELPKELITMSTNQ